MESTPVASAECASTPTSINWTGIALFIVLAFGISWAIWLTLGALGVAFSTRAALGMFGPAVSCLLVRLIRREGFADAGVSSIGSWKRGIGRLYLAAYVVPLALLVIGLGIALLLGVQQWTLPEYLRSTYTSPLVFALINLRALTLVIPAVMLFTFGEEFGWRG
jgi:uncharacterized protein